MKNRKTPQRSNLSKALGKSSKVADYVISMSCAFSDAPAMLREDLPEGRYVTLTDFNAQLRRTSDRLLSLSRHAGVVVLDRTQAIDLTLSLAYIKDTSDDLLGPDHSISALRQLSEKEMRTGVAEAKSIAAEISRGDFSFEAAQQAVERSRNPSVTWLALSVIGPKAPVIQTSAGPLDLSIPDPLPRELHSHVEFDAVCEVVGGLNESTGLFECRIISTSQTDYSLVRAGKRHWVRMVEHEHRTAVLVAQLFQSRLRARMQVDRAPFGLNRKQDLKLVLLDVEVPVEKPDRMLRLLAEQMHLELPVDDGV